jgi:hypothetical protein
MQTVLQWGKKRAIELGEKEIVLPLAHYLQYFLEWRALRLNPKKNREALKHFESLHGKSFVESLNFFEKMLEGSECET